MKYCESRGFAAKKKRDLSYVTVVPMCHRLHSIKDTCRCGWVDSKHRHERKDEEEVYD